MTIRGVSVLARLISYEMTMNPVKLDLLRPVYHFTPPGQWMNDPNGLVYFEGEYHLFYQYDPYSLLHGPMYWGHAVSRDLIHWEHLPIALSPDAIGDIWSGSVVVDRTNSSGLVPGGGLVAVFSYNDQSQGIAYSRDQGRSWTMYAGNPVIPTPGTDFRDPKVFWHEETRQWIMVIVKGEVAQIYQSADLIHWRLASTFGEGQGAHGAVWEMPDLFPLTIDGETKWVLLISIAPNRPEGSAAQYFVGRFDGTTFVNENPPETVLLLDYGPDNYAGTTWNDAPDGRRVYIGWMNNWQYAIQTPATEWRGMMTTPREFSLRRTAQGDRLVQRPVAELDSLRGVVQQWSNLRIASECRALDGVRGQALDILAEFELGTAVEFGVKMLPGGDYETAIVYNVLSQQLVLNRERSGLVDFHEAFGGCYKVALAPVGNRISMRILLDYNSVEVFGSAGEVSLSALVFPLPGSAGLDVFAVDGDVTLVSLAVYPLDGHEQD